MLVNPDRHTIWYQGIQRIYRNSVVRHLRTSLRDKYPQDWENVLKKPFAKEWATVAESAELPRKIGAISSPLQDAADYLGVNHFFNLFEVHFELLFPVQCETTPEERKLEKAAVLGWAKEIKAVRDPESHPPSQDMDINDVVRQLDTARRICSKFDRKASDELESLLNGLYSAPSGDFRGGDREALHRQPSTISPQSNLHAEALLLGPVQALDLTPRVAEAQSIASTAPVEAACLYEDIAKILSDRFPRHADRFEHLRATALKAAGDPNTSHEILMQLAIRDLWERAEPMLQPEVESDLERLHDEVDAARQFRGLALVHFGRCHEHSGELEKLAQCFDNLGPDDELAPVIATIFAEAALADRTYKFILDRCADLRRAANGSDKEIELRVRAALGDAGMSDEWLDLIREVESFRFPSDEGTYVSMRGARWCAWNGQLDKAESLYRSATKLGSEAGLDLDVANALWSVSVLYSFRNFTPESFHELTETNRMARSIEGLHSYLRVNPRTRQQSYEYLVKGELPAAHLWAQYRLLESIRSGCLMDELESHTILARIFGQAGELTYALEHSILGNSEQLVMEFAPKLAEWPEFLAQMVTSKAPWVRNNALHALEYVGDFAPPHLASALFSELLHQLLEDTRDVRLVPSLLKSLGSLVLDATDEQVDQLLPVLEEYAVREQEVYRITDSGVLTLAARLYRFRPNFKQQSASVLAEIAVGSHDGNWSRALRECGEDKDEIVKAIEQVGSREDIDLASVLSDLTHLTTGTRALWSQRLQFVADHPIGRQSGGAIGTRYDVPSGFLREQDPEVVRRYVDKLVAIACDADQFIVNRADALTSAANVMDVVSTEQKRLVFTQVQPLVEQSLRISDLDRFHASTLHPLSRFRISMGSEIDVRTAAGRFLALSATSSEDCSAAGAIALEWVRSDDSKLQSIGAAILNLPNVHTGLTPVSELIKHSNPSVRRAAVWMLQTQDHASATILQQLADDPDRSVRVAVARVLPSIPLIESESYKRIKARLDRDPSAVVRAHASSLLSR